MARTTDSSARTSEGGLSPFKAALLAGLGLGGLADVIVLHGILQWHEFIPPGGGARPSPASIWSEGLLLAASLAFLAVGLGSLWVHRGALRLPDPMRDLVAGLLVGWGVFNLGEGLLAHHVFQLHHVKPGPEQATFDALYLLWGACLVGLGAALRSLAFAEGPRIVVRHRRTTA